MPQMIKYFLMYRYITPEAKSKRYIERLERAEQFEWGHEVPQFIFSSCRGGVRREYPACHWNLFRLLLCCNQSLHPSSAFCLRPALWGGGKLMYYLNRTTFTIVYIAVTIFSINLGLRGAGVQAPSFFVS